MKDVRKIINAINKTSGANAEAVDRPDFLTGGVTTGDDCTYFYINADVCGRVKGSDSSAYSIAALYYELVRNELSAVGDELPAYVLGIMTQSQEEAFVASRETLLSYHVFSVLAEGGRAEQVSELLRAISSEDDIIEVLNKNTLLYARTVKLLESSDDDYKSAGAFAEVLVRNVREETGIELRIGVGGLAEKFAGLKSAYGMAAFALNTGMRYDEGGSVYMCEQFALVRLIANMDRNALRKFIKIYVKAPEIYHDKVIIETAEEFLKNDLNVSETSRVMYMHRNTLTYRLDKIERLTGLNIRKFNDAMTFKLISLILRIIGD